MEPERKTSRLPFRPADMSTAALKRVLARFEPGLGWIVLTLAAVTALVDRYAVVCITDAVYGPGGAWRANLAWVLFAVAGTFLLGLWARMAGLTLAERATDSGLTDATRRLLAADWRQLDASGLGTILKQLATGLRRDTAQAAAALPAILALPVTAVWLGFHEPGALLIAAVLAVAGVSLLHRETARLHASRSVLDHAEMSFDRLTAGLLTARTPAFPAGRPETGPLWSCIDDATRAASIHARAQSRVTGLAGWLGLVVVVALLAFVSPGEQDTGWKGALIMIAATLHHVRQSTAAVFAFQRVQAASAALDALAGRFAVADTSTQIAPARWTTLAFRQVRVEARDTPSVYLAAAGPLDIELQRGEIVALTGDNQDDRGTLLHLLCGLVPPDSGTILLDGRLVPHPILRGLCGGVLDRDGPPYRPPPPRDPARASVLLARFDLPAALLDGAAALDSVAALGPAERVRLAIVAAELEDRPIRVYDERAAHLEPRFRAAFAETLREARARRRTCVVATSDATLIAAADRTIAMRDGMIVPSGDAMT